MCEDDNESEGGEYKGESDNITSKSEGMVMSYSAWERVKSPVRVEEQAGIKAQGSQRYYKRVQGCGQE